MTAKKAAKKSVKVTHKKVKSAPDEVTNENGVNATITHADPEPEPMVGNLVVHEAVPLIDSVRAAWNEVREGDAPFDECAPDFQRQLLYHADGVAKTGIVQQDDTYLAKFERALARMIKGEN